MIHIFAVIVKFRYMIKKEIGTYRYPLSVCCFFIDGGHLKIISETYVFGLCAFVVYSCVMRQSFSEDELRVCIKFSSVYSLVFILLV